MPETITSYTEFSAGTKARATQVNSNFSNHRGTLLPITPNTATASHLTYNLGSTEYRWDNVYAHTLDLIGATTTANLTIERDSAVTAGAFPVKVGSTEVGYVSPSGVRWLKNMTVSANEVGGTNFYTTSSKLVGSLTIDARQGPILLELVPSGTVLSRISFTQAVSAGSQDVLYDQRFEWFRDGVTIAASRAQYEDLRGPTNNSTGSIFISFPLSLTRAIDLNPTAGSHTYELKTYVNSKVASGVMNLTAYKMLVMEI